MSSDLLVVPDPADHLMARAQHKWNAIDFTRSFTKTSYLGRSKSSELNNEVRLYTKVLCNEKNVCEPSPMSSQNQLSDCFWTPHKQTHGYRCVPNFSARKVGAVDIELWAVHAEISTKNTSTVLPPKIWFGRNCFMYLVTTRSLLVKGG